MVHSTPSERQGLLVGRSYGSDEKVHRRDGNGNGDPCSAANDNRQEDGSKLSYIIPWRLLAGIAALLLLANALVARYQRVHHDKSPPLSCVWTTVRCSDDNTCWIQPSEYESCMDAISLDTQKFVQSVRNLDATFEQWYPFYNQAAHPLATSPSRANVSSAYKVYPHPVNLHVMLRNVETHAKEKGASMASWWCVSEPFNLLRDAHINAIKGNIGNLTSDFWSALFDFAVFPQRTWTNMLPGQPQTIKTQIKTVFYYDSVGKADLEQENDASALRLNLERYDMQGNMLETKRVKYMDGLKPGEFIVRIAKDTPLRSIAFRSVGPRVNSLLARNFATTHPQDTLFKLSRKERIFPHHIFPDSFVVEYADDEYETFFSGIAVTSHDSPEIADLLKKRKSNQIIAGDDNTLNIDLQTIQEKANEPSCLYRNFQVGANKVHATLQRSGQHQRKLRNRALTEDVEKEGEIVLERACEIDESSWFTKAYNCSHGFSPPYDDDGPLEMGYKIIENFVVLKIDSFDAPPGIIFPLWREINKAAMEKGVHRLMIDLSNNGGGEVPMGLNLAHLMYPEVACEMFDNKYDMLYNEPMTIWAQQVAPLLNELENRWREMQNADKVDIWRLISAAQRKEMADLAEAMCILDLDHNADYCGELEVVRTRCPLLVAATSLETSPTLASFIEFVRTYIEFMKAANPWTVLDEFDVHIDIGDKTYIRGGKPTDFTNFLDHEPDFPIWWGCPPIDEVNAFSEYMLVSNGNSGSTTNTFQTTVEGIWKNKSVTGAQRRLTTVSYGGLGQDTPLTQFAGGTVDARVNTEVSFAGLAGLPLLETVFQKILIDENVLDDTINSLHEKLPEVPFYFQHFSQLPAVEIYNKFLLAQGETIPLEFIYFPPDYHIRDVFSGGVFDNPQAFESLYRQASIYFGEG
eukprot:scaffold3696_cov134-Amphora_coffeaeformis.AAC.1